MFSLISEEVPSVTAVYSVLGGGRERMSHSRHCVTNVQMEVEKHQIKKPLVWCFSCNAVGLALLDESKHEPWKISKASVFM